MNEQKLLQKQDNQLKDFMFVVKLKVVFMVKIDLVDHLFLIVLFMDVLLDEVQQNIYSIIFLVVHLLEVLLQMDKFLQQ